MRHHALTRKLSREAGERRSLMIGLAASLINRGRIKTTLAKAKALQPIAEKMVTLGKTPTLANIRLLVKRLDNNKSVAHRLVKDIAPKYKDRAGGYTRIIKLPARRGDASPMAFIEFV